MRRVQAGDRGRSGLSTTCLRVIEGALPGRVLCVWNVETPLGSSLAVEACAGGLTVRDADRPGGRRMTKKRMPAAETQRETATVLFSALLLMVVE
jgi:hypothetical protein